MGKYSKFKESLTKFQQPTEWQESIDRVKEEQNFEGKTNVELSQVFAEAKDEKATLEARIRDMNTIIEAVNQVLVVRLEDDDITSFKTTDGSTFFIKDEPYSSVSDKQAFHKFIKEEGLDDLFTVHYQTMLAMVKERLEKNEEPPPGISVYMKSSIQRRTSKA